MRIHLCVLLLATALLPSCPGSALEPVPPAPVEFTVLHFNDIHGQLLPFEEDDPVTGQRRELGGIARLATRVRAIEAENAVRGRPTFLLFAGDLLMGTPMSMVFQGEPGMLCFRDLGVDAFTVGNHEFDFGQENLRRLAALGGERVPIISCNIDDASGQPIFPALVELPLPGGASLAVVGATTEETPVTTFPDNVEGLTFAAPAPRIHQALAGRQARGPALVLSHMGWKADLAAASALPELFAVVGGHDQMLLDPPRWAQNTTVLQAYDRGRYLGRIDVRYDPATGASRVLRSSAEPITDAVPEDPAVAALVGIYARQLEATMGVTVATATETLDGSRHRIRYEETNLGNLFVDIMRRATGADVALLNGGSIRATLNRGELTMGDIYRSFPYANELWVLQLDGRTLLEALTRSVRATREEEDGGFLQVSGLRMVVEGTTVAEVTVGEAPLDPEATYAVAVTDFVRMGGDGYRMMADATGTSTMLPLRGAILKALREQGTVEAQEEGRILRR